MIYTGARIMQWDGQICWVGEAINAFGWKAITRKTKDIRNNIKIESQGDGVESVTLPVVLYVFVFVWFLTKGKNTD